MDYYTVFNMETGQIGFAPHSTSAKENLHEAELPDKAIGSAKTVIVAEWSAWVIILVLGGGTFWAFYYYLFPFLKDKYSNNQYYYVGLSTVFWLGIFLLFVFGLKPLFKKAITGASYRHGVAVTNENETQELFNVATFIYFAISFWIFIVISRSIQTKKEVKEETAAPVLSEEQAN